MPDTSPTPMDVYAALRLLEAGLKDAITAAAAAAEDFRAGTRAKQVETDWGLVSLTRRAPSIVVDDAALLQWADEHAPHLVTRTIAPAAKKTIMGGWEIDGDDVVDKATGEIVDFASVKAGGESLVMRLTPDAKALAAEVMTARTAQLALSFESLVHRYATLPEIAEPTDDE